MAEDDPAVRRYLATLPKGAGAGRGLGRGIISACFVLATACSTTARTHGRFDDDVAFLSKHVRTIVLTSPTGARVAVVPAFQGRVMTSTTDSGRGESFGWINRDLIASGEFVPHINPFGGEDRFWMGPEGGQFSVFFPPGAKFDLAAWQTPAPIDREPFELVQQHASEATFAHAFELLNWSGTRFRVAVTRQVRLCDPASVLTGLGVEPSSGVHAVSFETVNTVRNTGEAAWSQDTGLLSVWILGMFEASPACTVLVPFVPGDVADRGVIVNDDYFGKVPAERLLVDAERGLMRFRGDARYRSKIGIGPRRVRPIVGSWDEAAGVLTLVEFSLDPSAQNYVNSQWRHQSDPFRGDVVNSYNDGPLTPGGMGLGNFYELESSSAAMMLEPGQASTHSHRTTHLVGERVELAKIAAKVLGADLSNPW